MRKHIKIANILINTHINKIAAAPLKHLISKLIKKYRSKFNDNKSDEEIKDLILKLAFADPKNKGNLDKSSKFINIIFDFFVNNPSITLSNLSRISWLLEDFSKLKGKGRTDKKLQEFKSHYELESYINNIEEQIEEEKNKDIKNKILSKPLAEDGDLKVYRIDYDWEEEGRALFEHQTKWCVNEEGNYNNYKPLYLFTKNNSYYALYSPDGKEFNDKENNPIEIHNLEEFQDILETIDEYDEAEDIVNNEPPYELEESYIENEWDNFLKKEFIKHLKSKMKQMFEPKLYNEIPDDLDLDIDYESEFFELFNKTRKKENIEVEWEKDGDNQWIIYIDTKKGAEKVPMDKVLEILGYDDIEIKIALGEEISKQELTKIGKSNLEELKEKYPIYFNKLAEKRGQKKLFNSSKKKKGQINMTNSFKNNKVKTSGVAKEVSENIQNSYNELQEYIDTLNNVDSGFKQLVELKEVNATIKEQIEKLNDIDEKLEMID